jgi:NADPH:quinone reductase-like Zn-dependent oxidoreductase
LGTTLRNRSLEYQSDLVNRFWKKTEKLWQNKNIVPILDRVFDWQEVEKAHQRLEANLNIGKIVLKIS